jgi:hypothetical protein
MPHWICTHITTRLSIRRTEYCFFRAERGLLGRMKVQILALVAALAACGCDEVAPVRQPAQRTAPRPVDCHSAPECRALVATATARATACGGRPGCEQALEDLRLSWVADGRYRAQSVPAAPRAETSEEAIARAEAKKAADKAAFEKACNEERVARRTWEAQAPTRAALVSARGDAERWIAEHCRITKKKAMRTVPLQDMQTGEQIAVKMPVDVVDAAYCPMTTPADVVEHAGLKPEGDELVRHEDQRTFGKVDRGPEVHPMCNAVR